MRDKWLNKDLFKDILNPKTGQKPYSGKIFLTNFFMANKLPTNLLRFHSISKINYFEKYFFYSISRTDR